LIHAAFQVYKLDAAIKVEAQQGINKYGNEVPLSKGVS
jgi:hypothetical protein